MYLEGQASSRKTAVPGGGGLPSETRRSLAEEGFALAALLVAIAILSVMMLVALPTWRHQVQREKEAELVFRGEQYARAIGLYQRKLAGAFPPSLDALVEQKFLRKKYKDPITGEDFVPVFANSSVGQAALQEGAGLRGGLEGPPGQPPAGPAGRRGSGGSFQGSTTFVTPDGGRGRGRGGIMTFETPAESRQGQPGAPQPGRPISNGIIGVMSKSTAQSIRLYNGRDRYDQWIFTYMSVQAGQRGPVLAPDQTPRPQAPGLPQRGRGPGGQ